MPILLAGARGRSRPEEAPGADSRERLMGVKTGAAQVEIPFEYWGWFAALVVLLLVLDLAVFHRKARHISIREALVLTAFYVAVAVGFNIWVYRRFGPQPALEFLTCYLIEETLSVDNIFVFVIIFRYFRVEREYQHRVLFWGILATIVMRLLFILAGTELVNRFSLVLYFFGLLLIYTGLKLLFSKESEIDPAKNLALRLFKRTVPMTHEFQGPRFIVRRDGKLLATPLLLVLVVLNAVDLMFAVDSVPAVLAITRDKFIVFTSNICAIFGLRSIYFLLAGMLDLFRFLKIGLGVILLFIGAKMMVPLEIPVTVSLGVVAAILATSVIASLAIPRQRPPAPPGEEPPPFPPEEG
jgi:tellurite resistance protein TerC